MNEPTKEDYEFIGRVLVTVVGVAQGLGHDSPASLGPYVARDGDWRTNLVLDAFEAAQIGAPGEAARARITEYGQQQWLLDEIAEAAGLTSPTGPA
jgi:hypothetical protein